MFLPEKNMALYYNHQLGCLHKVQRHTLGLLQESNDILEKRGVWTKLFKSVVLARAVLGNSNKIKISFDSQMKQNTIETTMEKLGNELGQLSKIYTTQFDLVQMRWEKEILNAAITVPNILCNLDFYGAPWNCDVEKYVLLDTVGSNGTFPLQFACASSIAVHPTTEQIFVLDRNNHRIQVLNKDLSFYRFFGRLSSDNKSYKAYEFVHPDCIAISREGLIAVCEARPKIRIYDSQFDLICIIEKGHKRSASSKSPTDGPEISNPNSICFDSDGNFYVANTAAHNVIKFNRNFEYEWSFTQEISSRKPQEIFPESICTLQRNQIGVYYRAVNSVYIYDQNGTHMRNVNLKEESLLCCLYYPIIHSGPNNTILFSNRYMPGIYIYDGNSQDVVTISGSQNRVFPKDFQNKAKSRLAESTNVTDFCFGPDQRIYAIERNAIYVFGLSAKASQ